LVTNQLINTSVKLVNFSQFLISKGSHMLVFFKIDIGN